MRVRSVFAAVAAAAVVSAGAVVATIPVAGAADFGPVTNTADDGSATSLRSIIENDATNVGGDTVTLDAGATYTLTCSEGGDIDHGATPLTIEGNGATIRMEDGCSERILDHGDALLTLRNLTIRDGGDVSDGGNGGGFDAGGDVVLEGASIVDNRGDDGGGFDASGNITVLSSVISGNRTDEEDDGGGFRSTGSDATIRIVDSTVAGNYADTDGGGGFSFSCGASVSVVRSSITGNTTLAAGGAILDNCNTNGPPAASGVLAVNSTISGNTAYTGGGIYTEFGTVTLVYTTLAANTATFVEPGSVGVADDEDDADEPGGDVSTLQGPVANVIAGTLEAFGTVVAYPTGGVSCEIFDATTSSGYNYSDDASCGFTDPTDVENGTDPLLGALASNGGPTATHLPDAASPLVNAIPGEACTGGDALAGEAVTTDQRLLPRPDVVGQQCDIGSVEIQTELPPVIEPTFTG